MRTSRLIPIIAAVSVVFGVTVLPEGTVGRCVRVAIRARFFRSGAFGGGVVVPADQRARLSVCRLLLGVAISSSGAGSCSACRGSISCSFRATPIGSAGLRPIGQVHQYWSAYRLRDLVARLGPRRPGTRRARRVSPRLPDGAGDISGPEPGRSLRPVPGVLGQAARGAASRAPRIRAARRSVHARVRREVGPSRHGGCGRRVEPRPSSRERRHSVARRSGQQLCGGARACGSSRSRC